MKKTKKIQISGVSWKKRKDFFFKKKNCYNLVLLKTDLTKGQRSQHAVLAITLDCDYKVVGSSLSSPIDFN